MSVELGREPPGNTDIGRVILGFSDFGIAKILGFSDFGRHIHGDTYITSRKHRYTYTPNMSTHNADLARGAYLLVGACAHRLHVWFHLTVLRPRRSGRRSRCRNASAGVTDTGGLSKSTVARDLL